MCVFCEEPFRTILFTLAAIGLIVVARAAWKLITPRVAATVDART